MSLEWKYLEIEGYEAVIEARNATCGLHTIIAVHSTKLGPSLGGTRMFPYATREAGLADVLRLASDMTAKSSIAQTGLGGGKSIIFGDARTQKTPALLAAYAEAVNVLQGKYICAEDVGTSTEDMQEIIKHTRFVAGLSGRYGSGDPSRFTAWGCFIGLQAACEAVWGSKDVAGKTVALQGLGHVGMYLAEHLFWHGAKLIVADVVAERCEWARLNLGAKVVAPSEILSTPCDILAPCAMGGAINKDSVKNIHCKVIAGAANSVLATPDMGRELLNKGITYAPDVVINAGGIINVTTELDPQGYNSCEALRRVGQIGRNVTEVLAISKKQGITPQEAASQLAQNNLARGIGKRQHECVFHTAQHAATI